MLFNTLESKFRLRIVSLPLPMTYLRFVLVDKHPDSGLNEGLFRLAYSLGIDPEISEADRLELKHILSWFDQHLLVPSRFSRTSSKGYYRRATRGISWFRETSYECVTRMFALKKIFEQYGYEVTFIREKRIGYTVYEDEHQVVAEPFKDTETRG
jgi:hypothetical protein